MRVLRDVIVVMSLSLLVYSIILAAIYAVLTFVSWRAVEDYVRRRPLRNYRFVGRSPLTLPVSIIVPAYNEGSVIGPAVRALIESQFLNLEVLVVNDGSTDDTLSSVAREFDLVRVERVPRANLPTKPVKGVYVSPLEPSLVVIDKENGRKADALNAGLCYARYPLVCAIDADTILDREALSRLVWEFQAHPDTVAVGGIVRVLNGSVLENGRIAEVRTSRSIIENIQVLEYLRAFLGGRVGWSRLGMLLIVSGAFGLFRREVLIEAGGWDPKTVGEDAELVLRLHRHARERHRPCRITFFPDPICWTEAPSSLRALFLQRDRWQRGLIEMVVRHRKMIANPRYGRIGLIAFPYYVVFELLGPIIEVLGFLATALAAAFGFISFGVAGVIFGIALGYGLVLSFAALLMEERAYRRYPRWRCLVRLIFASVLENVGYRQTMSVVRTRALWTLRRHDKWGPTQRTGFAGDGRDSYDAVASPAASSPGA